MDHVDQGMEDLWLRVAARPEDQHKRHLSRGVTLRRGQVLVDAPAIVGGLTLKAVYRRLRFGSIFRCLALPAGWLLAPSIDLQP